MLFFFFYFILADTYRTQYWTNDEPGRASPSPLKACPPFPLSPSHCLSSLIWRLTLPLTYVFSSFYDSILPFFSTFYFHLVSFEPPGFRAPPFCYRPLLFSGSLTCLISIHRTLDLSSLSISQFPTKGNLVVCRPSWEIIQTTPAQSPSKPFYCPPI